MASRTVFNVDYKGRKLPVRRGEDKKSAVIRSITVDYSASVLREYASRIAHTIKEAAERECRVFPPSKDPP